MSKQVLKIGRKKVFPLYLRVLLTISFGFVLVSLLQLNVTENIHVFLMVLVSSLVPSIWTARYLFEVNTINKTYGLYTWVMGMKFGKSAPYQTINGMTKELNPKFEKEQYSSTEDKYLVFLDLNEGEKLLVLSGNNESTLSTRIDIIKSKLGVELL